MYFIPQADDRPQQVGLRGFSDPPPRSEFDISKDKILRALWLNPVRGYVKGSSARRILDAAVNSVPPSFALELVQQLEKGKDTLGKLFRYRLADPTQRTMLNILLDKARIHTIEIAKEDLLRRCAPVIKLDKNFKQVCSSHRSSAGKYCQELRDEAQKTREIFERTGDHCP